jgi:hypothetical protein
MADEIITELWKIKDEAAAETGYDLRKRYEQLRKMEKDSKVRVVNRAAKRAVHAAVAS